MYDIYASYTSTCHNHLFSTHEAPGARRLRTALSPTLSLPNTPGPMDCPHSLTHSLSLSSCASAARQRPAVSDKKDGNGKRSRVWLARHSSLPFTHPICVASRYFQ